MDVDAAVPALEELLGQAAWVRRLARSLTRDEAAAEDATQDAFLAVLERPPRQHVNLRGWAEGETESAAAAAPGLIVAAWVGLALLAGSGSLLVWRASQDRAHESAQLSAAVPPSHSPVTEPRAADESVLIVPTAPETARVPATSEPSNPSAPASPLFIGSVRDPDGAPIERAALAIYPNKSRPRPEPIGRGVAGPDGRFAFPIGPTDSTYLMIGAEAEGHQGLTMDPVVADKEISIELTWRLEVFGVVRDAASGASLAGVELSGGENGSTVSDERGNFRLGGFPSGLQRSIRARLDGYAATEQEVLVRGKEAQPLDLELMRGTAIEVEVFERETGRPLAGAGVHDPWRKDEWTSTAANGRFTTWVAREHPLEIDVTLEGYWPLTWQWTPVDAGLVTTPRLPMAREIWIQGRIADEHGARIEGDWL